ncbi:MAG: hypothetical protein B6244_13020 [Candidatus Cloacimonetes bacterium 4572_55]|nr:MAG: hypothetical protein B6244_13020 [Candidatus Cloacimonetes bacterium 4572_55]
MKELTNNFLKNVSYELKRQLSRVHTAASSLIDRVEDADDKRLAPDLRDILSTGKKMSELIDNLLDAGQLQSKEIRLSIGSVSIDSCAAVVVDHFKHISKKKPLHLINKINPNLSHVQADQKRLRQILLNLAKVLIECTKTGFIEVSAKTESENLVLIISSTGNIKNEKLRYLSKTGQQIEDLEIDKDSEIAFNFAIAKQLIELHGDKIHINSIPEKALKFSFKLPLAKNKFFENNPPEKNKPDEPFSIDTAVSQDKSHESRFTPDAHGEKPFKILVVDDEPTVCHFLSQYLRMLDFSVIEANSGVQALEMVETEKEKPNLILLDVMMPKMNGFEVCRQIRRTYPSSELPIILLTARGQMNDVVEGFKAGANDYVTKPFSNSELVARIKTHLQLAHINAAYSRFVPKEFLKLLGHESIVHVKLGEQVHREMTIFFADIRSFTALSENMTPRENFEFLNSYLKRVSPVIWENGGFIDKYIGDAMMALFPNKADDALAASIDIMNKIEIYNRHRHKSGYEPIRIGMGMHTGPVVLGTIGYSKYMQGTVISDAVNLASRIENLTKLYGSTVLVSEQTLFHLKYPEKHNYRFLDLIRVKGKKHSISVFEIFDVDDPKVVKIKQNTRADFEQGVYLYHSKKFKGAFQLFKDVANANKKDSAAHLYVRRCEKFIYDGMPKGWDGVETLQEKF